MLTRWRRNVWLNTFFVSLVSFVYKHLFNVYICQTLQSLALTKLLSPTDCVHAACSVPACSVGHVQLFAILWTAACQAPLPMGLSRQEYWSGLPCSPPGDLLDLGIETVSSESLHCRHMLYCWAFREAPLVTNCHLDNYFWVAHYF